MLTFLIERVSQPGPVARGNSTAQTQGHWIESKKWT